MRGLIASEQLQRSRHYLTSAAEWTSRAIVSLDLAEKPVKSIKQASQLEGVRTKFPSSYKRKLFLHSVLAFSMEAPAAVILLFRVLISQAFPYNKSVVFHVLSVTDWWRAEQEVEGAAGERCPLARAPSSRQILQLCRRYHGCSSHCQETDAGRGGEVRDGFHCFPGIKSI